MPLNELGHDEHIHIDGHCENHNLVARMVNKIDELVQYTATLELQIAELRTAFNEGTKWTK